MILFVDVGWLGSPVDVGTFLIVLAMLVFRLRPRVATIAAAVVALAERRDDVDDDRLRSELEVDSRDVEALRPRIVRTDGGDNDG
ncbi:hypothetical protein [Halobellus limi]|uniref:Uncharacterized protein n=1 Tax=Halobellus limi TaxID=699433 RepID=A0A1H5T008_9EURY|nr:hypothetical protein [Halobellus limi]QCC47443.1 hypothetical protein DV707_07080 [Halobellus limi]SEF56109.1 hypothetical protein SAMN04488133_0130 [Halobellus limi]